VDKTGLPATPSRVPVSSFPCSHFQDRQFEFVDGFVQVKVPRRSMFLSLLFKYGPGMPQLRFPELPEAKDVALTSRNLCGCSLFSFVALILAFGPRCFAQFQAPTPDELKMTADPKYPDAAAVYLNYEMKTDNEVGYESVYARIKILKESAKELATVTLKYPRSQALPQSRAERFTRTAPSFRST